MTKTRDEVSAGTADRRELLKSTAAAALATMFPWGAAAAQSAPPPMPGALPPTAARGEPALTAPLSRYIAASPTTGLPDDVGELGKRHILDTIASIVVCRDLQPAVLARRYASASTGGGPATILGTRERASLVDAVFASAIAGHA